MKKISVLVIALLLATAMFADVVIGTGTSTQYYPMSTYYNYYRSAALYLASEINVSSGGTITHLKWDCGTANTTTSIPVTIYMKQTTATTLANDTWANINVGTTAVYTGTCLFNTTGWYTFDINDFAYDGTSNLEILVESGSAPFVSPYVNWRYTTTTTNLFTRAQADGSAPTSLTASTYRPNITLVGITTPIPPNPTTLISPLNGATGVLETATLNWNAASGATGYKLYFGTDNPPTNIVNGTNLGNVLTYDPVGNMAFNTTFYWKVVPTNAYGDASGCPVWSFTTRPDPTIYTFPYTVDFENSGSLPPNWTVAEGASGASYHWAAETTTANGPPAAHDLYIATSPDNIYDNPVFTAYGLTGTSYNAIAHGWTPSYNTRYFWMISATNGVNSLASNVGAFRTEPDPRITSLPYTQNFDGVTAPALPLGWTANVYSATSPGYVYVNTTTSTPQSAPNNVCFYNSDDTAAILILASPEVTVGINNIKLKFWARWGSYASSLIVGTMSDPTNAATFTAYTTLALTSTYTQYIVSMGNYAGTDHYLAFKMSSSSTYAYIYLDTIEMLQLLPCDLAATSVAGVPFSIQGTAMSFNVTVFNEGTATQPSYTVNLRKQGGAVLTSLNVTTPLYPNASAVHTLNWTPGADDVGSYNIVGEVVRAGDGNSANNISPAIQITVYPAGTFIPQVGYVTSTLSGYFLPLSMYYKNSISETIYLHHEMQMTSGTINAIIYQNTFTQDLTKPIKIWMKNTTTNNLVNGWLPFADYTLVFNGSVHFPVGINSVLIPLTTPFNYTGGNLAVRVYRVWEDAWWNNTNKFYYTNTPEAPNRSRCGYADGTGPLDPSTPSVFPNQYILSYLPNTAFVAYPATPVTISAPVVTAAISGTNVQLTWPAVTEAYAYRIYASDDPYNFSMASPLATVHTNFYTFEVGTNTKQFFKVVATSTYRNTDLGTVLNPAAAKGIDNNKIKAEPLIPQKVNKD